MRTIRIEIADSDYPTDIIRKSVEFDEEKIRSTRRVGNFLRGYCDEAIEDWAKREDAEVPDAIPVKWIKDWLWENGDFFHRYNREAVEAIIVTMLQDWEEKDL